MVNCFATCQGTDFFSSIQTFKIELHSKKDTCYHLDQAFSYKIYRAKFIIVSGRKIFCAVTWCNTGIYKRKTVNKTIDFYLQFRS